MENKENLENQVDVRKPDLIETPLGIMSLSLLAGLGVTVMSLSLEYIGNLTLNEYSEYKREIESKPTAITTQYDFQNYDLGNDFSFINYHD